MSETSEEWSTCRGFVHPSSAAVLDLRDTGRKVAAIATDLGVTGQPIYN